MEEPAEGVKMMKKLIRLLLICLTLLLFGCSPSPESISQAVSGTIAAIATQTPYPTNTAYPTLTAYPTYTPAPPTVIVVTPTATETPLFTPTDTNTPTETSIPTDTPTITPTFDPLTAVKRPGIYLVNVDIAPGVWKSNGTGDDCYWKRSDRQNEIIDNHFGFAGGTIYIATTDFSVELHKECGEWEYIGPP